MTDYGKIIKELRLEKKWSLEELAERAGTTKQVISRYERGERIPKLSAANNIAAALGVPLSALMGEDDIPDTALSRLLTKITDMPHHYVPLIGSVAAGQPIFAEENYDCYVDAPRKADYALRIEGDSMTPNYLNGDVVYIRQQPDVEDGEVGVVLIDDSATLKHVYHTPDGLLLLSDNPAYKPINVKFAEHDYVRVLGKVCGYTRMF